MIITSIPDYSLQYDEPLSLLRVGWASGADMQAFRASCEQALHLGQSLGVRRLLLDMNAMPDISVYDQVWLGINFMPGFVKLPLEHMVLVNHRRRVHNQLAIDSLIALMRPLIKFDIQYFSQPVSGLHWLTDGSARLPALLAEWNALHGPQAAPDYVAEPRPRYRALRA